ncbi:MAG: DUF6290 family protein [Sphaerochaeta sp.]|uniref:type II toxin-antitoxin system RelB family antitoxin n=1 Tax=Sphaerochaeta associata TaxID=1129264 RepID=UPI000E8D6BEE|nr:DUF6290 family protein [Sphaerochaeta associata]MEA4865829.1 DUF6290 family protein [Sphaerochaeta sp.]MEA5028035.1 DUF6290 family protein [Sphaerochaeta associata]HAP56814.1 CopG family transcriptional regulator [Sphaerochaeta sp.]HBO35573.1 CopG family transcriptional regulator [Sphaerochaeta sp.]
MGLSVRLKHEELELIQRYAELKGLTISELVRQSILERIEDEFDLQLYEKAISEFRNNPVTYSLDEIEQELGLK